MSANCVLFKKMLMASILKQISVESLKNVSRWFISERSIFSTPLKPYSCEKLFVTLSKSGMALGPKKARENSKAACCSVLQYRNVNQTSVVLKTMVNCIKNEETEYEHRGVNHNVCVKGKRHIDRGKGQRAELFCCHSPSVQTV